MRVCYSSKCVPLLCVGVVLRFWETGYETHFVWARCHYTCRCMYDCANVKLVVVICYNYMTCMYQHGLTKIIGSFFCLFFGGGGGGV